MPSPYLSVIIPAYNEERRIADTLQRLTEYLQSTHWGYEIIVVANGCTDRTVFAALQARLPHVLVYQLPKAGKGAAVRKGMLAAKGQYRYMCDADLSCPPKMLDDFVRLAQLGCYVVIGDRTAVTSRVTTTLRRQFAGRIFNWFTSLLVPGIPDTQCGFKLFQQPAAEYLFARSGIDGFAFDVELLYLAQRAGMKIGRLPVTWQHDPDSRVSMVKDSLKMLCELVKIKGIHATDRRMTQNKIKLPV